LEEDPVVLEYAMGYANKIEVLKKELGLKVIAVSDGMKIDLEEV
jgi:hypothetical protein